MYFHNMSCDLSNRILFNQYFKCFYFTDGPLTNNVPQMGGAGNDLFGLNQGNLGGTGMVGGPRMQMQGVPQPRTTPPPGLVRNPIFLYIKQGC